MNLILLSGGSGKRLWPLSNDIRSKQFLKLFCNDEGVYESMVQRVYRQIKMVDPYAIVTIATGKNQVSTILSQLGNGVSVCVEPERRDTFPAIALAAAWLSSEQGLSDQEIVIVCPVDPYVDNSYFEALFMLSKLAEHDNANLYLMGVEGAYPSEKYGYIIPETKAYTSRVKAFKEKPDLETAKEYISQGALWNCGVFAFKIGYLLNIVRQYLEFESYWDLYCQYGRLEKNSFDYCVVEKEQDIKVLRYQGAWKDIGSWNTLTEELAEEVVGKAIVNETCKRTYVINELNIPVVCMGMRDTIVAASGDGILVTTRDESGRIKPIVETFYTQAMCAEKSWGSFQILDMGASGMTIKLIVEPGCHLQYHSHEKRDEVWTILSGTGKTIVDGMEQSVKPGDVITMEAGCKHTIFADTKLNVIEVQLGSEIDVNDKKKFLIE